MRAAVTGVRPQSREVHADRAGVLAYDALVLAPGARAASAYPDAVTTGEPGSAEAIREVLAAGDATIFPVKQGGLAAQQADAVAAAVAAATGAAVTPRPFTPVLRGPLLTGGGDRFLRAGLGDGTVEAEAQWWPRAKVAGAYLAPYLSRVDEALSA